MMPEAITALPLKRARAEHTFPVLTPPQIARISQHGRTRQVADGEILIDVGETVDPFVVTKGQIEIVRPADGGDTVIVVHQPGQFTGEVNLLSGRRSLVRARARAIGSGEVIELDHASLLSLVQTDSEISEIIMRAFIL